MVKKKKILIVEDNDQNRLLLCDLLTYHGYAVLETKTGVEGIELARKETPDLVLMDIQMPVLDGLAAGRILKEGPLTSRLKIIALTSFAMRGDSEMILAAGFDGYIAKPIDTRELPLLIKKALEEGGNDN